MSEAVPAQLSSQRARPVPARGRRNRLNPLEALERGFVLFRSTFALEAWRYYTGAAPLILCFIPIWVVNGQIRMSNGVLLMEAVMLTGGYMLRVWMVGRYLQRIRHLAFGTPPVKPAGVIAQVGRLLTRKIVLSAGVLAALPTVAGASWCYSACQFASLEAREDGTESHSIGGCLALASQWFGGSLLLFVMLFPLWIAVWLNGVILAIVLPRLLHSIFGMNTLLSTSMGMSALFRSSAFWLALFGGAWLALDPIVKCTFVVVYQHLRSRHEGDDLRGLLASLPREQEKKAHMIASPAVGSRVKLGALALLALILTGHCQAATASAMRESLIRISMDTSGDAAHQARVHRLRQALDAESQRAIYRWHNAEQPSPPTWFDKLLDRVRQNIEHFWDVLANFLRKLWPSGLSLSPGNKNQGTWHLKDLRFWLLLVAALTLGAGGVLVWLRRQRHEAKALSIPLTVAPLADLSDGTVATERSENEWFALADRLEGQGDLRFALRAAYFGLLAGLAQREWLTIRRHSTNHEYLDEFARRWRRRPQAALEPRAEILEKLRGSLRQFDRVWYGSYALTPEAVAKYRRDQRELLNHV